MKREARGKLREHGNSDAFLLRGLGVAIAAFFPLVSGAYLVGCADRATGEDSAASERPERPEGSREAGRRSFLYAACETVDDCGGLKYCLRPAGELGFCTQGCAIAADDTCDLAPEAPGLCRSVSGEQICVLDCSDARCPLGMRCERVEVDGEPESLCF